MVKHGQYNSPDLKVTSSNVSCEQTVQTYPKTFAFREKQQHFTFIKLVPKIFWHQKLINQLIDQRSHNHILV